MHVNVSDEYNHLVVLVICVVMIFAVRFDYRLYIICVGYMWLLQYSKTSLTRTRLTQTLGLH